MRVGVAVLPGFNDAHAAFIAGGLARDGVDLFDAETLDDMKARIGDWADAHAETGWIVGRGWTYQRFADLPTRAQLDAAVKDRPVVMFSQDGHAGVAQQRGARPPRTSRRRSADPNGGVIVRDARTGEPTGLVKDAAVALVAARHAAADTGRTCARAAPRDPRRAGAWRHQRAGHRRFAVGSRCLRRGQARGRPDRPRLCRHSRRRATAAAGSASALDGLSKRYEDDALLKAGMAVVTLDGAVESQTAAVLEPYSGRGAADGLMKLSPQDLTKTVSTLDSHGWQVAVTANGDRAVRAALDAYRPPPHRARASPNARRHRIEGVELVDPDDVPRFEGLGVIASLQPAHARPDRLQVWSRNVGPDARRSAGPRTASRVPARVSRSDRIGPTFRSIRWPG